MNTNTFNKLGYYELLEKVKKFCVSELGKTLIDNTKPVSNLKLINIRLNETTEAKKILNNSSYIPLNGIHDINFLLDKIRKGGLLDPSEMTKTSDFLRGCRKLKKFMKEQEFFAPTLSQYTGSLSELKEIEDTINNAIKNNMVDSSASKELAKIRRKIGVVQDKIEEKLNKFLSSSIYKEYIQEYYISKRNGRFVIPIKSAFKSKIDGTIIDTSSKGTTVFIEPSSVSKLNNELDILKYEQEQEEYQILSYLTGIISEEIKNININVELIAQYDMIFARAKYSNSINGIKPIINSKGYINIVNGVHPLIDGVCVPLNASVGNDYRTLVITGPNAGGKTVALKTIGILTLAVQSGLHINAEKNTELSVFDNIFVDIGDNQSIKNALSTFSSHIKNIAEIVHEANNSSLILLDEIGSGTEPNEGSGLAISILEEFYHKGCITVATTHYADIKDYASRHPEFQNAHMKFNPETLEPLYEMIIGEGGESNALWISRKMGLKESVLQRAKLYINSKDYNFTTISKNKIAKDKLHKENPINELENLRVGDKVKILESNEDAIVFKEKDKYNNIEIMIDKEFRLINRKRVKLVIKREDLYPEGYDFNDLFESYAERKLQHDIQRGSKKVLKKIHKDIKKNRIKE